MDLSSPGGASVNDGINPDEFSLHYITVDKVIRLVSQFGRGALMAKFDVESAYRNVPIHPPVLAGNEMAPSFLCGFGSPVRPSLGTLHL